MLKLDRENQKANILKHRGYGGKIDFGKDIMKKQCKNLGHQPGNLFSAIHCMKLQEFPNSNQRKLSHGTTLVSFKLKTVMNLLPPFLFVRRIRIQKVFKSTR